MSIIVGNFANRQFTIINGNKEQISFQSLDTFADSPDGLGFESSNTYYSSTGTYYIYNTDVKQNTITLNVTFGANSGHAYQAFYNVLQKLNIGPLQLQYDIPDIGTFYRDVTINSIPKSDLDSDFGTLVSAIKLDCLTPWYQWKSVSDLTNFVNPSPKVWMNTDTMVNLCAFDNNGASTTYVDYRNSSAHCTVTGDGYYRFANNSTLDTSANSISYSNATINTMQLTANTQYTTIFNIRTDGTVTINPANPSTTKYIAMYINGSWVGQMSISVTTVDASHNPTVYQISATYTPTSNVTATPYTIYPKGLITGGTYIDIMPIGVYSTLPANRENGMFTYPYVYSPSYGKVTNFVNIQNDSLYLGSKTDSSCIIGVRPTVAPIVNPSWSLEDEDSNVLLTSYVNMTVPVGYTLQVISDDYQKKIILSADGMDDQDVTLNVDISKTGFIRIPTGNYKLVFGSGIDTSSAYVQFKKEWMVV